MLSLFIIILTTIYVAYVLIALEPRDLQVAVHYTAFGETHFYREKWYYMIAFAAFGIVVAALHIAIMAKLVVSELRPLGIAFGWLTVIFLIVTAVLSHAVLGIAFLS